MQLSLTIAKNHYALHNRSRDGFYVTKYFQSTMHHLARGRSHEVNIKKVRNTRENFESGSHTDTHEIPFGERTQ